MFVCCSVLKFYILNDDACFDVINGVVFVIIAITIRAIVVGVIIVIVVTDIIVFILLVCL